ncbi:MAG: peroxiredoxin [Flavobacterium sp.]|jgi:peroxiredoxin
MTWLNALPHPIVALATTSPTTALICKMKLLVLLTALSVANLAYSLELGDQAPDFELTTLGEDKSLSLSSFHGKVVFLDFWASWCPPCLISIPEYAAWAREIESEDFVILTINLDKKTKKALHFLKKHPVPYAVLWDASGGVAQKYKIPSMPTSYIIDQDGRVSYIHKGFKAGDLELIKEEVKRALK